MGEETGPGDEWTRAEALAAVELGGGSKRGVTARQVHRGTRPPPDLAMAGANQWYARVRLRKLPCDKASR